MRRKASAMHSCCLRVLQALTTFFPFTQTPSLLVAPNANLRGHVGYASHATSRLMTTDALVHRCPVSNGNPERVLDIPHSHGGVRLVSKDNLQ
ncbi:unnamed protein product [Lampetra fluviatilis]